MATFSALLFPGFNRPADPVKLASDPDITFHASPWPSFGARTHAIIAAALTALVVYASLFPFHFEGRSFAAAAARIEVGFRHQPIDAGDFLGNILLFIPLGYFLLGALRVNRTGGSMLATTMALSAAFALSLGVEMLQAFFPPRMPCVNDVLAQVLGASLGVVVWQFGGRHLTDRFRRAWTSGDLREHTGFLLVGYVTALVVATMLPFDLDVGTEVLGRKFSAGFARVLEFDVAPAGAAAYLWDLFLFAPAGILAAYVTRRAGRRGEKRRAFRLGLVIVLIVTAAALTIRGKRFDCFAVAVQLVAFGLGWLQGRSMRRCWHRDAGQATPPRIFLVVSLAATWLIAATTLLHGQPLNFTDNPTLLASRMETMNWLPLYDIYGGNYLLTLRTALLQSMLFLTGGAALALGMRSLLGKGATMPAAAVALFTALILEVGQLSRMDLQPSVTAILWQATAAWLAFVVVRGLLPPAGLSHKSVSRLRTRGRRVVRTRRVAAAGLTGPGGLFAEKTVGPLAFFSTRPLHSSDK